MFGEIAFPLGIPGFEAHRQWLFVPHASHPALGTLRSLASPNLRLILVSTTAVDDAYELALEHWDSEALEARDAGDLATYFVVCVQEGCATVNMLAPVVINPDAQRGVQAVRADLRYSHAAPLILARAPELQQC